MWRSQPKDVPLNGGFLGTAAPAYADVTLLLEIAMGVGLLVGALLARFGRFRQHAWCQSVIVLVNLALIVVVMVPSFVHVSPKMPTRLGNSYYALAAAHAALGGITEIASVYILLAAGTSLLPEKFRIVRYKRWMRSVLALWWLVLVLGMATYARWYTPLRGTALRNLVRIGVPEAVNRR